jgi:hypothetical protein
VCFLLGVCPASGVQLVQLVCCETSGHIKQTPGKHPKENTLNTEHVESLKSRIHLWYYLFQFFLEWEMFQTEVVEKIKTHFTFNNFFPKIEPFMTMWNNNLEPIRPRMTIGAWALHDGYLRLQTHTHKMKYLLLLHGKNGYTNTPQCYVSV